MATLIESELETEALRALEIRRNMNRNIDRILEDAKARNAYKPWEEMDNASDTDQFIEGVRA